MSFKNVVYSILIKGRTQKLWPKMSIFTRLFADGVQWKLDISRYNNFHKKSCTTFFHKGLLIHVLVAVIVFVLSSLS